VELRVTFTVQLLLWDGSSEGVWIGGCVCFGLWTGVSLPNWVGTTLN